MEDTDIPAALRDLPDWRRDGIAIRREVACKGFARPMLLANAIAHRAEQANHHPALTVAWGALTIRLWTHATGGLTARDFALARRIERLLEPGPVPD